MPKVTIHPTHARAIDYVLSTGLRSGTPEDVVFDAILAYLERTIPREEWTPAAAGAPRVAPIVGPAWRAGLVGLN